MEFSCPYSLNVQQLLLFVIHFTQTKCTGVKKKALTFSGAFNSISWDAISKAQEKNKN